VNQKIPIREDSDMRSAIIVSCIMFGWLIFAAITGYLMRPKSESDPLMGTHGDVPAGPK
jgi:hypothetical protein